MNLTPSTHTPADVIRLLDLQSLEHEGGYFRRTAESSLLLPGGARRAYSAIYLLITPDSFSALHRLTTDEIWCFHAGDALESLRLHPDGRGEWVLLGLDVQAGQRPQDVVAAGVWQGSRLVAGGRWALASCIVAPEFRWEDFTLARRDELGAAYPEFRAAIASLTRDAS